MSNVAFGGIAGFARNNSQIVGCTSQTTVDAVVAHNDNSEMNMIGGIVGWLYPSDVMISGCTNKGDITLGECSMQTDAGGIVGYSQGGAVRDCTNGDAPMTYLGGIIGNAQRDTTMSYCSNEGPISPATATLRRSVPGRKLPYRGRSQKTC